MGLNLPHLEKTHFWSSLDKQFGRLVHTINTLKHEADKHQNMASIPECNACGDNNQRYQHGPNWKSEFDDYKRNYRMPPRYARTKSVKARCKLPFPPEVKNNQAEARSNRERVGRMRDDHQTQGRDGHLNDNDY